ncbi:hypothetical protein LJB98_00130 [Bacteroidales bacterium OttesenSCG-928-M11]|nr:hypothetical protein [Bacteroidales bacterium OttesenSCG-928-M11]
MKKVWILLLLVCFYSSCEEEYVSNIPYAKVNLELNTLTQDYDLIPILSYKTFTQRRYDTDRIGYGGILVTNGIGTGVLNLYAYDLSCPVEAMRNIRVVPNDYGEACCERCGAKFNISSGLGNPISGTSLGLKTYSVTYAGNNTYRVVN